MLKFDNSGFDAIQAAQSFDRFAVELPDDAVTALHKLMELRQSQPEDPPRDTVAHLIADSAKPNVIDAAIAAHVGANHRQQQHRVAETLTGRRVLAAIMADRARLHTELAVTADELIDRLHRAALITESVVDLARAKRPDDAHLLAVIESDAAELKDLYVLRDRYLTADGARWSTGWWSCQHWRTPWDHGHVADHDSSQWGAWRAVIRAGGNLWFVPIEEATAASAKHEPSGPDLMTQPFNPRKGTFV
ncbi:hypothetical protein JDV09_15370 [Mycobacterium sp. Y57]|uniref:hypothetical protein n=1 Tax=Mycolicibacterium xanthum TaxID=2796469 RepID=UPI001C84FF23|nr:hypothetical protein [Mycolicibacterium xanthum]MBX7433480.1 hypothetical protein [Mycolicibacterium xanthum]